jgi:hypothetical protein
MPCLAESVASTAGEQLADLLFAHLFTAGVYYRPTNKPELVTAVAQSTDSGHSLRALGSNWCVSSAGVADDIVDTTALGLHLSQPYHQGSATLGAARLREGGSNFLAVASASDPLTIGRNYMLLEAGTKIKALLEDLAICGLALPTMGDGAGQSLIGALSTATHGADFQVPPLVEWLRAIHLVGPAGQEWWITPTTTSFGNGVLLSTLTDWCPDTQIVADDETFDAVRVGVGRMGVVYAVIVEVVAAYALLEVNLEHRWSDIRAQLPGTGIVGGVPSGIFNQPIADLDNDWFRGEVLKRTRYQTPRRREILVSPTSPQIPNYPMFPRISSSIRRSILRSLPTWD